MLTTVNNDTGHIFTKVLIEAENTVALIDRGAGVSLISCDVMDSLRNEHISPTYKVICNASRDVTSTSGRNNLSLKIRIKMYTHDFVISENKAFASQITLGIDFIAFSSWEDSFIVNSTNISVPNSFGLEPWSVPTSIEQMQMLKKQSPPMEFNWQEWKDYLWILLPIAIIVIDLLLPVLS